MRVPLAFITLVAAIMSLSAVLDADWGMVAVTAPVLAVAGAFLWRNLRDPAAGRAGGLQAVITFTAEAGAGLRGPGTFGMVRTYNRRWAIVLDRAPEQGDPALWGTAQRGWVWLDAEDLPQKARINYGSTWKTWPVTSAAKSN